MVASTREGQQMRETQNEETQNPPSEMQVLYAGLAVMQKFRREARKHMKSESDFLRWRMKKGIDPSFVRRHETADDLME
jgi:hypothetical protein